MCERHGYPQIGRFVIDARAAQREGEGFRHHSDYGVWRPVDINDLANNTGVSGIAALPEPVAQDRDVFSDSILVECECPSNERLNAEHRENRSRNARRLNMLRPSVTGDVNFFGLERADFFKRALRALEHL